MTGDAVLPHHLPYPTLTHDLETEDGHQFQVAIYNQDLPPDAPMLLHFPAMGTKARNYRLFAGSLNQAGIAVGLADLRGHGTSSLKASHSVNYGYKEMLTQDWPLAIKTCQQYNQGAPVYLMGHSLGGQLSCAYAGAHPEQVKGLILIASCSVYYGSFGKLSLPFRLVLPLVVPIVKIFGHFPGDSLGFARREGAQVMRDWMHQGITGRYEPKGDPHDYEGGMAKLKCPMLVLEMEGDKFAPPKAVNHLINKMPEVPKTRKLLPVPPHKHGVPAHFDWVKKPEPITHEIRNWLPKD